MRDAEDCKGERGKGRQRESVVRKGEWSTLACQPASPTVPSPRPHCQPRRSLINLIFNKPCDDAQGNAKTGNIQLSVKLITCQGGGRGCCRWLAPKNAEISIAITITITITSISTNTGPSNETIHIQRMFVLALTLNECDIKQAS